MAAVPVERHRLAGTDERARGFNRQVEIVRGEEGFQALLQYEATRVVTPDSPSPAAAMQALISQLQGRGYTQLRSQLNFRDQQYLGSQEVFVDYPDPPRGLFARLRGWLGAGTRRSLDPRA
jgi:hypothetical protein